MAEELQSEWSAVSGGAAPPPPAAAAAAPAGDQDAMAAEWEAMLLGETDSSTPGEDANGDIVLPGQSTRILNQEEIDSLLGFSEDTREDSVDKSGVRAILNSSMVSYERLPMLEIVFDRLVKGLSTSLRNFTQDNVEVTIEEMISYRFDDYVNSIPLPAILAVFKAEEWDNLGLLTIDSPLVYSIVDVLLGGRRGVSAVRVDGRPYTTIERNLMERMIHVILGELSAAFDPLSPVTFRFERIETNPRFATVSRPSNAAVVVKLRIDMEDRGGRLEILIPYATMEPIRELLLQMFSGEKFGRDSIWETHLTEQLWLTDVPMDAVLDRQVLPLSTVLEWKPGSRLLLDATPDSDIAMHCGDIPIFAGKMGRKDEHIAIQLTDRIKRVKG
ncbi:flagellar motor switch protein FliM [Alphaproteobacteria bacterium]|nr:flagellar motor switch protein FliM [Alphaproteobacteria bacterium]